MKKTKLITLLRTLDDKEMKDFESYLTNLYRRQAKAITVFKFIKRQWNRILAGELTKEEALKYQSVKALDIKAKGFSNVLSTLYLFLEEFLILNKIKSNPSGDRDFQMIHILKERKLNHLYQQRIKSLNKTLDKKTNENTWNRLKKFQLNHLHFFYTGTSKMKLTIDSLDAAMDNLDLFYGLTKLKYLCEIINRSNILQQSYNLERMESAVGYCRLFKKEIGRIADIYLLAYELLREGLEETFAKLRDLYRKNIGALSKEDQSIILGYLINFTIAKVQEKPKLYYGQTFALYKLALEQDLIVEDGIISSSSFINIATVSTQLGEFTWFNEFVSTYQIYLPQRIRPEVLQICFAQEAFERGRHKMVLDYLKQVKFATRIDFALRVKALTLRAQWELLGNDETVRATLNAFEMYLRRNKEINEHTLKAYLNFIRFAKKLFRKNTKDWAQLVREIERQKVIYFKYWLVEKAKALR
ncbi:MAG: hypothetical protein AAFQ92_13085 [Bacteroidota bacterium]|mgnify:CR=1 FL=1